MWYTLDNVMEEKHNWEFIKEVEDWIDIPKANVMDFRTPKTIYRVQLEKATSLLQECKDRLVKAQRELDKETF